MTFTRQKRRIRREGFVCHKTPPESTGSRVLGLKERAEHVALSTTVLYAMLLQSKTSMVHSDPTFLTVP
jgi:hypothetical protein